MDMPNRMDSLIIMSKVRLSTYGESGHCGHCSRSNSTGLGLTCALMRASDYDSLMAIGWRRCGSYYYNPDVSYLYRGLKTIRCHTPSFVPNKSQRKVLRRLLDHPKPATNNRRSRRQQNKLEVPDQLKQITTEALKMVLEGIIEFSEDYVKITRNGPSRAKQYGDYSIFSCISICSKNKQLNIETIFRQLVSVLSESLKNTQYYIFYTDKFHINLVDTAPVPVGAAEHIEIDGLKHEYSSELVNAVFTEESYQLFRKYQIAIHKDPPNKLSHDGYERFLCGKNLETEPPSAKYPLGLGNFHQLHRIDGQLVAVGVLDLLPSGISNVYYFYDPDYRRLSLEVLGALKEIELINSIFKVNKRFQYYYIGLHIDIMHQNAYKKVYLRPEILCPAAYTWMNAEYCLKNPHRCDFSNLSGVDERRREIVDPDMDWWCMQGYLDFVKNYAHFELDGYIVVADQLNLRKKQQVFSIMAESKLCLSRSLLQRLIFKLN